MEQQDGRKFGGDLWEGVVQRRASHRLVFFESVIVALIAFAISRNTYHLEKSNAIAVSVIAFILVGVLLSLPIVGMAAALILSGLWGYFVGAITLGLGNGLFLTIVLGVLAFSGSLGAHMTFRE